MLNQDNTFIDSTTLVDENSKNNKKYFKYEIPIFFKDLLNLLIPIILIFGLITFICFII